MKTIVLIAALAGLTLSGYAQQKNCSCKKTVHRTAKRVIHKKTAAPQPVYTSDRNIKDCPIGYSANGGCLYDSSGNVQYMIQNTYSGYYPDNSDNVRGVFRELYISSPAFSNYGTIPSKYTCEGSRTSPPIAIGNIPAETRSLAVIVYDTHATERQGMTYWMAWNIDTTGLIPENYVNDHMAMNSANEYGYQAVCPANGTHYYHFVVYALDARLKAGKRTSRSTLEDIMKGHILARGELIGTYNRRID